MSDDKPPPNWRRGLFRLWLVLSVLWIAGVSWSLDPVPQIRETATRLQATIRGDPLTFQISGKTFTFPRDMPLRDIERALTDAVHISPMGHTYEEVGKQMEEDPPNVGGLRLAINDALAPYDEPPPWRELSWTIGLIALPPLFVLASAFVVSWVVRGFRR
jgi:hypothetical protein